MNASKESVLLLTGEYMDADYVMAAMCWPDDPEKRLQYIVAQHMHFGAELEEYHDRRVDNDRRLGRIANSAPSRDELLREVGLMSRRGLIAGRVLLNIWRDVELCDDRDALIRKATGDFVDYLKNPDLRYGNGDRVPSSRAYVEVSWKMFRPVVHLWAAFWYVLNLVPSRPLPQPHTGGLQIADLLLHDLPLVLAVAQEYLRFGQEFAALHQKGEPKAVIPARGVWRLPESVPFDLPTLEIVKAYDSLYWCRSTG